MFVIEKTLLFDYEIANFFQVFILFILIKSLVVLAKIKILRVFF